MEYLANMNYFFLFGEKLIIDTPDNGKHKDELSITLWQVGQELNSNHDVQ